jgi:hypothetical protein
VAGGETLGQRDRLVPELDRTISYRDGTCSELRAPEGFLCLDHLRSPMGRHSAWGWSGRKKGATPLVNRTLAPGQKSGMQQVHTRVALPAIREAVGLVLTVWHLDVIGARPHRDEGGSIQVIVRGWHRGKGNPEDRELPVAPWQALWQGRQNLVLRAQASAARRNGNNVGTVRLERHGL